MRPLNQWVPPGVNPTRQGGLLGLALLAAAGYSVGAFLWHLQQTLEQVEHTPWGTADPFLQVVGRVPKGDSTVSFLLCYPVFFLFLLVFAAALVTIGRNYARFWQGSKSIYLMRRLPDRWELHRQCLTLPLLSILAGLLLVGLLLPLFFWVYTAAIPDQCLPRNPWDGLWSHFLSLFIPYL